MALNSNIDVLFDLVWIDRYILYQVDELQSTIEDDQKNFADELKIVMEEQRFNIEDVSVVSEAMAVDWLLKSIEAIFQDKLGFYPSLTLLSWLISCSLMVNLMQEKSKRSLFEVIVRLLFDFGWWTFLCLSFAGLFFTLTGLKHWKVLFNTTFWKLLFIHSCLAMSLFFSLINLLKYSFLFYGNLIYK